MQTVNAIITAIGQQANVIKITIKDVPHPLSAMAKGGNKKHSKTLKASMLY